MNDIIGDDNLSAPTDLHIECKNIAKTNLSSTVGKGIGNRRQGAVRPSKRNFASRTGLWEPHGATLPTSPVPLYGSPQVTVQLHGDRLILLGDAIHLFPRAPWRDHCAHQHRVSAPPSELLLLGFAVSIHQLFQLSCAAVVAAAALALDLTCLSLVLGAFLAAEQDLRASVPTPGVGNLELDAHGE